MPQITLKMIAAEAGVTVACVSQALNGRGRISPERVACIKAIAERLGYRPDPLLSALGSRRFRPVKTNHGLPLVLLEFPIGTRPTGFTTIEDPRGHRLYREELRQAACRLGYTPRVQTAPADGRYDTLARVLWHRGVRAIVITGRPDRRFFADPGWWAPFSLVQCGRAAGDTPLHTVRPDIVHAINTVFRRVRERGYRRVGFAPCSHPGGGIEDDHTRLGATLALLERAAPRADRIPPYTGSFHTPAGFVAWARRHRPDACIAFSRHMWWWLRDAGIHCPRDAGFASLHVAEADMLEGPPRVAGINQCADEIARQALLLADQMVRHGERGLAGEEARQVLVREKWVEGETLPFRTPHLVDL